MSLDIFLSPLLNLLAPLVLGGSIVWTIIGIRSRRAHERSDALLNVLELVGWLLVVGSSLLLLVAVNGIPLLIPFLIAYVVVIAVTRRYRESERRALCTVLATAAERRIPLGQAVRAFSCESGIVRNFRVLKLADLLDAGMPLVNAMSQSRIPFPHEVMLAIRLRGLTDDLGPVIRTAMRRAANVESLLSSTLERMFYLLAVVVIALLLTMFWVTELLPMYQDLCWEFDYELPAVTAAFASGLEFLAAVGFFGLLGMLVLLLTWLLAYLRWLPVELPVLRRFWLPIHGSAVLHCLSIASRHQRPMATALELLRKQYPVYGIRKRLGRAAASIDRGSHWCQGLLAGNLINAREAALLGAAERVGNLAWALDETAERSLQRVIFRLRRIMDILFPLAILLIGACVLLVATAQFVPLIYIIKFTT